MNFRNRIRKVLPVMAMALLTCTVQAQNAAWTVNDSVLTVNRSVREIPGYAFQDRNDFHTVRFETGSTLRSIGEYAFLGCGNLRNIELPVSVTALGEGCFRECSNLSKFTVPARIEKLPKAVFSWCQSLHTVSLPSRLTDIGSHAFAYCTSLASVTIPSKVTHIGSNAFSFCSSLTEITLPASVTELESYAFSECVSLKRATLPRNHRLLGELIFDGCISLFSLTEASPVPPKFDCSSQIFDLNETDCFERCVLFVPATSLSKYRTAPGWRLFRNIRPL